MKNIKAGMTASDVIEEIVRGNEKIKIVNFVSYRPNVTVMESGELSLRRISHHNHNYGEMFLTRNEILNGQISKLIEALPKDFDLSISSRMEVGGKICHLPLIDFYCDKTIENLKNLYEIVATYLHLIVNGVFLDSGRSYHFYSSSLMDEKIWVKFMAHCSLFDGYIDHRWVSHRLIDGFGCLRISARSIRTAIPTVVEYPSERKPAK